MPHTINGVGTHYYGRKNLQTRPGVCEFCRRESVLSSYDTRLWFVFIFIPLIPLGKKHILNYCPKCTRHRVTSLAEWEKIKNQNLSDAMAGVAANPQDPKAAIKAHSALIAFGHAAEADKLSAMMAERFANDAPTQAYLGSMMQYLGKFEQAIPYYERALSLDPELAEAKVAVALNLIQKDRLDDAHKLLRFLEAPGVAEYSGALFALATGYQRAGRHADALVIFNLLLERFPKLSQDKKFRQAFKQSQEASGAPSTLPPRKVNWGPLVGWGGAIAIVLLAILGSNYYISQHRTLYLVSGFAQPVTVNIPGHEKTIISNRGVWTMTLPEGKYQAAITGATNQTVDFTIVSTFFGRWFGKPLYILNAGGSALLYFENATYSANPGDAGGSFNFYFGKSFLEFPRIDYPFAPLPERITLDNQSSAQKNSVELFHGNSTDAFMSLVKLNRLNEAMDLAEWYLRIHPDATEALPYYSFCAEVSGQTQRALAYYAQAVKRRPVELEWHRMYQEARIIVTRDAAQVIAEYDALLQADPTNSALLYLDGRLQTSKKKAVPLYQQAIAQNSSNYFAHYALAQSYAEHGDWDAALPEMNTAVRLDPENVLFEEEQFQVRMAVKDYSGLEKDLQAKLRANPLDLRSATRLADVFITQDRADEMKKLLAGCESNVRAKYPGAEDEVMSDVRAHLLYSSGKFEELQKLGSPNGVRRGKTPDRFDALVELGRLQDAADALKARGADKADAFEILALSAAWKQTGNDEKASTTRTQAVEALLTDRPGCEIAAKWLKDGRPVPLEDVLDLSIPPERKKTLLVALAQITPENSAAFLAAARRLNVSRSFPFHLINRLTDTASSPK
jgi:tetratricopeptide (TPR) repeat protein